MTAVKKEASVQREDRSARSQRRSQVRSLADGKMESHAAAVAFTSQIWIYLIGINQ
jgi:hypothetical protein